MTKSTAIKPKQMAIYILEDAEAERHGALYVPFHVKYTLFIHC